jgi:hypothetical protein
MDIGTLEVLSARYKQPNPMPAIECVKAILGEHKLYHMFSIAVYYFAVNIYLSQTYIHASLAIVLISGSISIVILVSITNEITFAL